MRTSTALALLMFLSSSAAASNLTDWRLGVQSETYEVLAAKVELRVRLTKVAENLSDNGHYAQVAQWNNWNNHFNNWPNWRNW